MTNTEQQALLTIALMAAFADGEKADSEREAIRSLAESLGHEAGGAGLARLYQDVLLKRVSLAEAVNGLGDGGQKQLAYEMAVCVCDADGRQSPAESAFLSSLKDLLGLDVAAVAEFEREEQAMVAAAGAALPVSVQPSTKVDAPSSPVPVAQPPANAERDAELDRMILNSAKLNGALELLPQSWASMAIIPLQVRMVYNIGKAHGVELDQGHIREFIAAVGVGLTSQYIEQFGRKLLGGLIGSVAGRMIGGIGRAATGVAFSFATTYALGQVAKRYYAGGRVMSTALLQETFQNLLGPAKQLQTQWLPEIRQTASTLDAGKVMQLVRGT
ncbi:MAG: GTPase [Betaproteobacteria bacterium HGW-Betaproteobacteria-16]|nr:MAG: GTPase [Betaproteobacteria bacterium HGW-Betaproteobacteria-16]